MTNRGEIEKLWAGEKYNVMMHSQRHYNLIREELKKDISYESLEDIMGEALSYPPDSGAVINTFDHMWGYFKKVCTDEEKSEAMYLKDQYKNSVIPRDELLMFIKKLADKYTEKYLQNSTVLLNLKRTEAF